MDPGEGPDRGPTATLLSTAALASLAAAGGADRPLDRRRFRMTFGIDGVAAHAEDRWLGRDVRIGGAVVRVAGNVGRCAVTTHDPDTGRPSFDTLHVLNRTRGHLATSEPLPFGVWAEVISAGPVGLGDPVEGDMTDPSRLRLGLNLPYEEGQMDGATPRWADVRAMATTAEAVGFDAVWISDHVGFGDPAGRAGAWSGAWESWTLLSALAAVDHASGARDLRPVHAVPEPGPPREDGRDARRGERRAGHPRPGRRLERARVHPYGFPFAERFGRFADSTSDHRGRCSGPVAPTHDGRYEQTRDARLEPRGPRPSGPPIMVGTTARGCSA